MLHFASDYQEGAHPEILRRLNETNLVSTAGYGTDEFCESARRKIREACECPGAEIHFLVGFKDSFVGLLGYLCIEIGCQKQNLFHRLTIPLLYCNFHTN